MAEDKSNRTKLVCSQCGAKRWTMQQMLDHVAKKHAPKKKGKK